MTDPTPLTDKRFASRVDWNLMRTFVDIVRAGGIGAAARQLNRQQPSISAALKRLED
ncbi:MAG TPA: LysR family transcriptional regulator, partial [Novosphingobium sp.]|nr:LysR family transcriptional regulator [Novosphingobium sp.]